MLVMQLAHRSMGLWSHVPGPVGDSALAATAAAAPPTETTFSTVSFHVSRSNRPKDDLRMECVEQVRNLVRSCMAVDVTWQLGQASTL